jgi:hypothetical protein
MYWNKSNSEKSIPEKSVEAHSKRPETSLIAGERVINSPRRLARSAGVLYLLVGICGGFAEGFVEPSIYAASNVTTASHTLIAGADLVRLGIVADLCDQVFFLFLALTLYALLKHVHRDMARAMVILVAIAVAIGSLNTVFEFEGLQVATGSVNMVSLGSAGVNALVMLLLDSQHYGLLIAQIFFGLWLLPLGYLAYNSAGWFPRWLGVLLIVGGVCYLIDTFALFLFPDFGQKIAAFIVIPSAIAEISMVIYLLVVGVKGVTKETSA